MEIEDNEQEILLEQENVSVGGGAVNSVNGQTGDVVLTTSDLENTSGYQTGSEVESAISTAVGGEATAREQADTRLDTAISGLTDALATETTARTTADANLQRQIDGITGGSGPTVVSTTGTSTTDVMSQNATTSMVFADPSTTTRVKIGASAASSDYGIAIGKSAAVESGAGNVAIGHDAHAGGIGSEYYNIAIGKEAVAIGRGLGGSMALGAFSGQNINANGIIDVGSYQTAYGYDNSNYRLLTGVHDPVNAHDAATKGYVDGLVGNIETALNTINNGGNS